MTNEKAAGNPSLQSVFTALAAIMTVVAVLHPFLYWGMFSGDAEIHLIYARNFLRGYPLKFNLGMANSGETSMGYMLIDSLIMRLAGAQLAPWVIKFLCTLELYATGWLVFLLGKDLGLSKRWAYAAALCFLLLPGDVYSSSLGTENVLFALICAGFALAVSKLGWFRPGVMPGIGADLLTGLCAGALFWIRPEAGPFIAILLAVRLLVLFVEKRAPSLSRGLLGIVLCGIVFAACVAVYFVLFRHYAGEPPYGAGKTRRLLSVYNDSVVLLGIAINTKVTLRLASYFSIVVPAIVTLWVALRGRATWLSGEARWKAVAYGMIFFAFMGGYVVNVLPSVHFARYSVFVWPFGLLVAGLALQELLQAESFPAPARTGILGVVVIGFVGVVGYETLLRRSFWNTRSSQSSVKAAADIPMTREQESAALAQSFGIPVGAPANLAYQEVQVRYNFTDNFQIISLDGITDSRLLRYMCKGWIDHDGYLIDTKVDYVMDFPDYNSDHHRWALHDLMALPVGAEVVHPGITYTKIAPKIAKVDRTVSSSADRPGGICPAELRPFDHASGSPGKPAQSE